MWRSSKTCIELGRIEVIQTFLCTDDLVMDKYSIQSPFFSILALDDPYG